MRLKKSFGGFASKPPKENAAKGGKKQPAKVNLLRADAIVFYFSHCKCYETMDL